MSNGRISLDNLPDVLYVKELAEILRTSDKAVRHKIDRGHIRAVKIGGRIVITKSEVLRLLGLDQPAAVQGNSRAVPSWRNRRLARVVR